MHTDDKIKLLFIVEILIYLFRQISEKIIDSLTAKNAKFFAEIAKFS
jgi:hypothetical protein